MYWGGETGNIVQVAFTWGHSDFVAIIDVLMCHSYEYVQHCCFIIDCNTCVDDNILMFCL